MLWIRIKYKLRLWYLTFALKLGFKNSLLKNRYGERILVFHGIDETGETKYNSRFISRLFFEKLIKHITTHYNVISLDDFYLKKFKKGTLNIAITFDDGYLNNYTYAVPVLKKYNIPACFYITTIQNQTPYLWTDFLDLVSYYSKKKVVVFNGNTYKKNRKKEFTHHRVSLKQTAKKLPYKKIETIYEIFKDDWSTLPIHKLNDYWQLMGVKHIKEIAEDPLFTIGSHGQTHTSLITIPIEDAKKEIFNSKEMLETICNKTINQFAFPFGYYSIALVDYCSDIGYKKILLVDYNSKAHKSNEALQNRFVINPYISLENQLVFLLKGSYF